MLKYGPRQVAALWAQLMSGVGYPRFATQDRDWGAAISTWLAREHAKRLVGVDLNFLPGSYRPSLGPKQSPVSVEEQAYLNRYADWGLRQGAYDTSRDQVADVGRGVERLAGRAGRVDHREIPGMDRLRR